MATTGSVGDHIERLALQRLLDHIHAHQKNSRGFYELADLAEATGLDPSTTEDAMEKLEAGGPYTVDRVDAEYSGIQWSVSGSPYDLGGWDSDVWNVQS